MRILKKIIGKAYNGNGNENIEILKVDMTHEAQAHWDRVFDRSFVLDPRLIGSIINFIKSCQTFSSHDWHSASLCCEDFPRMSVEGQYAGIACIKLGEV